MILDLGKTLVWVHKNAMMAFLRASPAAKRSGLRAGARNKKQEGRQCDGSSQSRPLNKTIPIKSFTILNLNKLL